MIVNKKTSTIVATVLAAGRANRFGATKQLLYVDGEPLVRRAARIAADVCDTGCQLIVGHDAEAVAAAAAGYCDSVHCNERYDDGMASSLALAATAAGSADALLVILADQVRVTALHLQSLLRSWSGDPLEIVATDYGHATGAPTLLPSGTFAAIAELRGDQGARVLFDDPRFALKTVRFAAAAIDIDTPADLAALLHAPD